VIAMPLVPIHEVDDPRIAVYRDLPQKNLTRHSGRFIAEGDKVALRLIESSFPVESLLAEAEMAARFEPLLPCETPIYVMPKPLLQRAVGFHFHRGVLACGMRQQAPALSDLIQKACGQQTAKFVVCPDVQDPTNLGSIIRTAAAFGCSAMILGPKCADPLSRRVLRVSMAASLHLPIVESRDLAADLRQLTAAGCELVATVLDRHAEPLASFERQGRMAVMFGSEGHGLADEWLALAQRRLTIPMAAGIDSLNVAVAAAVVLWQLCRSRLPGGT
jgi:tRNA G18 (ribose-2'-O)-methylase SpoU